MIYGSKEKLMTHLLSHSVAPILKYQPANFALDGHLSMDKYFYPPQQNFQSGHMNTPDVYPLILIRWSLLENVAEELCY